MNFSYTPNFIPSNVFIIGAGGTGSRLMPMLAQFMRSITRGRSPMGWVESPTVWLIDDDEVELKNLLRQNFIQQDVGKPKAQVVAERYSRAYETDIVPLVMRITSKDAHSFYDTVAETMNAKREGAVVTRDAVKEIIRNSIVIICVDSAQARREIMNVFIPSSNGRSVNRTFFIDAGNEDSFGQVSIFTPVAVLGKEQYDAQPEKSKIPKLIPFTTKVDYLPMDVDYYVDLVDTESTASCADLNQTLAINALMAVNIMGIVQNFYYRKPFTYNCLRISLDGGNITDVNTVFNWKNKSASKRNATYVTEKNGSTTPLTFLGNLSYVSVMDMVYPIRVEFERQEQARIEAERERKRQEALALKNAERDRLRALAKANYEALIRAEREAEEAQQRAQLAVSMAAVEVVAEAAAEPAAEVAAAVVVEQPPVAAVPPPLTVVRQGTPRQRQVIELPRPEDIVQMEPIVDFIESDEEDEEEEEY